MEPIDQKEAQYRLLYTAIVAGKSANFARGAMQRFMGDAGTLAPYDYLQRLDKKGLLGVKLKEARTGSYTRLTRCFRQIASARPNLLTAGPAELEAIHGIGPKSARFAIIWVRPKERFAALDTHVLKWLRFLGYDAPKATPSGEKYARLERLFIAEADRRGFNPRLLDAMIWEHASGFDGVGRGDPTTWPEWLQKEPAAPPPKILEYFKSYAT